MGATQANFTVVDALLKPWQGVLCADSGHINVHETGAVEATGHKCLALPSVQGKITAQQVRDAYDAHWADASHEHIAQPGMVYISNPTEDGTLYTKEELTDLSATCYDCGLCLFVDGARMAYGLASEANDLNLQDYANLCDVFYLGGTKCGALFGEALSSITPIWTRISATPSSSTAPCWPRPPAGAAIPCPAERRGRHRFQPLLHYGR